MFRPAGRPPSAALFRYICAQVIFAVVFFAIYPGLISTGTGKTPQSGRMDHIAETCSTIAVIQIYGGQGWGIASRTGSAR